MRALSLRRYDDDGIPFVRFVRSVALPPIFPPQLRTRTYHHHIFPPSFSPSSLHKNIAKNYACTYILLRSTAVEVMLLLLLLWVYIVDVVILQHTFRRWEKCFCSLLWLYFPYPSCKMQTNMTSWEKFYKDNVSITQPIFRPYRILSQYTEDERNRLELFSSFPGSYV